jgi:tetratricopeptide (TPR) repeat protein
MLIGHSFGGLAVLNALTTHTNLFNAYVCIDPSMWWDNMNYLKSTKKAMAEQDFKGATLYIGMANTMDEGMDIKKVQKDTTVPTRGIRSVLDLDNFIKKQKPKGLRYASKYYENETHNSVPLITEYDALRFIFEKYQLKIDRKDVIDSTSAFAKKVELRYRDISKLFGYEVKPPEPEINAWGYRFLQRKQFKKAEDFFKLNVYNYPESFNVYDSYGDFFVAVSDKAKAIEMFKKALSIKENTGTRDKLNKLLQ